MFVIHRMVEGNHQLLVLLECVPVDPYSAVVVAVAVVRQLAASELCWSLDFVLHLRQVA